MRKDKKKIILIMLLSLFIFTGLGLISTTLDINGISILSKKTWNIHFENLVVNPESTNIELSSASIDSNNSKLINCNIVLDKPYDFYEFNVDVKNDGNIDAMVEDLVLKFNNQELGISDLPTYIDYTVTYPDNTPIEGNHSLKSNEKETYKIKIYFNNTITVEEFNSLPSNGFSGNLTFEVKYTQSDSNNVKDRVRVIFDPNGGTVDTPSKMVTVGSTYDELPTPTREGYTFMGWNGKNLAKPLLNTKTVYGVEIIPQNDGSVILNGVKSGNNSDYFGVITDKFQVINNTQYKISIGNYNDMIIKNYGLYGFERNKLINYENDYLSDGIQLYINEGTNLSNVKLYPQIEEGDTDTTYEPYYITNNTTVVQDKNHTLKAIWEKKETTFISGIGFNKKLKKLANPTLDYTETRTKESNVKKIIRTDSLPTNITLTNDNIVSTSTSKYPIYAWFSNGNIYYYSEALNPMLASDATYMFSGFLNLTSIDLNALDTSNVSNMQYMFFNDTELENLDLRIFDTSNVTGMGGMFEHCHKLKNVNLSSFDTSNVYNFWNMFDYNYELERLDLSSFDMSSSGSPTNMLRGVNSLIELKTPKVYPTDSSYVITLPKTLYDSNNIGYNTLGVGSPTSTLLTISN